MSEENHFSNFNAIVFETRLDEIMDSVEGEILEAVRAYPPMNSAHEGFAVLKEEVDELWDHVKVKPKNRDLGMMRVEAIQVAAMALRFAIEICDEERGRK